MEDASPEQPMVSKNEAEATLEVDDKDEEPISVDEGAVKSPDFPAPPSMKGKQLDQSSSEDEENLNGFWHRQAKRMARSAWIHLGVSMVVSVLLSGIAVALGGFEATVDNAGWQSRGTLIADRQTQLMITDNYQEYLFSGGSDAWTDLQKNVQPGWETNGISNDFSRRLSISSVNHPVSGQGEPGNARRLPFRMDPRLLQESEYLQGCDVSWYTNWTALEKETHLWPIWKTKNKKDTILDPELMHDLCISEESSQAVLEKEGLCFGCEDGCLPPYSVVLYARLTITDGFTMSCKELSEEWTQYQAETEDLWTQCVEDIKATYDPTGENAVPESCPVGFSPGLVEENFDETAWMTYSSSIFATTEEDVEELYDIVDQFHRGTDKIYGAYDTQNEDFVVFFTETAVGRDMALACGSAIITTLAILLHTRSPFLTGIGLLQIILSFPLSFFVYTFIGGLNFFPFLNFIGVFVVFALGADDIFVATDKWKNARIEHPSASTEYVAATALPDAAASMFLTTITTAIAFFGTAICPVAPIKMFAIFCGLLIMFDYILCVLFLFPALCIYDRRLQAGRSNCCIACHCKRREGETDDENIIEEKESLIRRILLGFYGVFHRLRWGIFIACAAALGISIYVATTLELPTSADVRILDDTNEFEQNYLWRKYLLYDALQKSGGSEVTVGFGLTPADTGDINNPEWWSQLVLDDSFDPSSEDAQMFMASFCPSLFEENFADLLDANYTCPFNDFESWLDEQAASDTPDDAYTNSCEGAKSFPIPQDNFHSCMIAWSKQVEETRVLSNEGEVKIIFFKFASQVRWDSPFEDLDDEWHRIEKWFDDSAKNAPAGVNKFFSSSNDFWWYDTNGQMLTTAYGAAAIALGAAAAVLLFSSRSFTLTLFAMITIVYVLTSVTATLVAFGWTLGFLESICFAILIGISVDFVIHFCHSYAHQPGEVSRSDRTKFALIRMGPSILAAAFTTIAAATIMLFTVVVFFQKFALILFMTVVQASIGSFIVFLVLVDCIGPSNPTSLIDGIGARLCGRTKS